MLRSKRKRKPFLCAAWNVEMTTLLVTHPAGLNHITPAGHPERPDRLRAVARVLADPKFDGLIGVEAPPLTSTTLRCAIRTT